MCKHQKWTESIDCAILFTQLIEQTVAARAEKRQIKFYWAHRMELII